VELFNSTLQNMLSMYIHNNQKDWDTYLPYVLFTYHCSLHESTQDTPFFLTYGQEPNFPIDITLGHEGTTEAMSVEEYHGELVGRLVQAQQAAHLTQQQAQDHNHHYYDHRQTDTPTQQPHNWLLPVGCWCPRPTRTTAASWQGLGAVHTG
jgi:hypothetical protein